MLRTILFTASTLTALANAQSATVTIETSHSGAGNDLTNATITVPLNTVYTNDALDDVSYLFLSSATGVNISEVTCTPYLYSNGTGDAGLPFNSTAPSYLSTNDVEVGSLVCTTNNSTTSSAGTTGSTTASAYFTSSTASSNLSTTAGLSNSTLASNATAMTSTFITTMSASAMHQSTVTSVAVIAASSVAVGATEASATTSSSSSATSSPTLASGSAGSGVWELSGNVAQCLAILGFGIAFVL